VRSSSIEIFLIQVLLVVEFHVDRHVPQSKAWRRLDGCELERVVELPEVVLAPDNVVTLPLDGEPRDLQLDHMVWDAGSETLRVHAIPEAGMAEILRRQGVGAWRPWVGKHAAAEFLRRCEAAGWHVRGAPRPPSSPSEPPPVVTRREPTL